MRFDVLGALSVSSQGVPLDFGGPKERTVLARLLIANGDPVPVHVLVHSVWDVEAPRSAVKTLQTYVLRLRQVLEPERTAGRPARVLQRTPGGYRLDVPADAVDARRFEQLVAAGRAELPGDPAAAAALLTEAVALWRGPAYAGFEDRDFAAAEAVRLEELRLTALEELQEARLATGELPEAVADLRRLTHQHPLRERLWCQLLLALYRSGRQADALEAYAAARRRLAEEVGVEPGPALRQLHAAVLAHDRALLPAAPELPAELSGDGPLLERDDDLNWLRAAWRLAAAGTPQLVALAGPPGIGKTRLAAALAREVHELGAAVEYLAGRPPPGRRGRATLVVVAAAEAAPSLPTGPVLTVLLAPSAPDGAPARILRPLSPAAASELAASVLGSGYGDVPALEHAAGVPGRVLRLARQAARERADAGVAQAALRISQQTVQLAESRRSLVTSIEQLHSIEMTQRTTGAGRCPFPGLAAYDVGDADVFFGRERLVAEVLARVAASTPVAVVGPSGSGKSSLARAGLLARLREGALPGSATWSQLIVRPGEHPVRELAHALLAGASEPGPDQVARLLDMLVLHAGEPGGAVVLVDQFEEILTVCRDPAERTAFLDLLLEASAAGMRVVVTVRADYYGSCAAYPSFAAALADATVLVPPMLEAEMRRSIDRPAAAAGLTLDDGLTDALIADVGNREGGLPLLATTLRELWEGRTEDRLTLAGYVATGGVDGAVARLAEAAFGGLPAAHRDTARRLLLRLTGPGDGDAAVRRRVPLSELQGLPDAAVRQVLEELTAHRLLTAGDGYVELAHEALLRDWPRLRGWLDEDRAGRAVHRRLMADAAAWNAEGRDPGALYRGARLAAAAEWADAHPAELTANERTFVEAGRAEAARETDAARRQAAAAIRINRRLRGLLGVAVLLTVAALLAGSLAVQQRRHSAEEATLARSRSFAAAALAEPLLDRALLLAAAGVRLDDSPATRGALLSVLARAPAADAAGRTEHRLFSLDVSRDWRTIVAGAGTPGAVHVWTDDLRRHRSFAVTPRGAVWDVRLAPDGRTVVIWLGYDYNDVVAYDLSTGRQVWRLRTASLPPTATLADNGGLAFSPDGTLLAANTGTGVAVIDAATHRVLRNLPEPSTAGGLAFASDRTLLVTRRAGHGVTVWDPRRGVRLRPLRLLGPIAVAPSRPVVLGLAAGSLPAVLDLRTGRAAVGTRPVAAPLALSADGRLAATASADRQVQLWDTATMRLVDSLGGHSGAITAARFLPGGSLLSSSHDGSVMRWQLDHRRRLGDRVVLAPFRLENAALDSAGTALLGVDSPGRWWLLEPIRHRRQRLPGRHRPDATMAVAPRRSAPPLVAVAGSPDPADGPAALFSGPRRLRSLGNGRRWVNAVALSGGGGALALLIGHALTVVDPVSGRPLGRPAPVPQCDQCPVAVASGGRRVAVGSPVALRVVEVATGREWTLRLDSVVTAVDWAGPDSLVFGLLDGRVESWRVTDTHPREMAARHAGQVLGVAASPDGTMLASGGLDGTVRLWDARTGHPFGQPLPSGSGPRAWVAFRPGGGLLAVSGDGTATTWQLDPRAWPARACAVAGREITRAEWAAVAAGAPPQPVCR